MIYIATIKKICCIPFNNAQALECSGLVAIIHIQAGRVSVRCQHIRLSGCGGRWWCSERVSQRQTKARHSGQFPKLKREQRLACSAVRRLFRQSSSSFESEARHSIQICCPAAGLRSWQVRLILQGDLMELHLQRGSFSPHVATTIGYPPGEVHLSHEKKSRIVLGDPCGQGQPFVDIAIRVVL